MIYDDLAKLSINLTGKYLWNYFNFSKQHARMITGQLIKVSGRHSLLFKCHFLIDDSE